MVFHSFYILVIFVSFTGHKNYVPFFSQHGCRFDCLRTVGNAQRTFHIRLAQSGYHILNDIVRLLKAGIVGCEDHLVAKFHRFLRHQRTFAFIPVSSGTYHSDDASFSVEHFFNAVKHISQSIRCMGIIDNGRISQR